MFEAKAGVAQIYIYNYVYALYVYTKVEYSMVCCDRQLFCLCEVCSRSSEITMWCSTSCIEDFIAWLRERWYLPNRASTNIKCGL
ncbi:hypothetical protein HBI56_022580 [Parastagonospora nodorum]|uniref:Uncharacterized protein n=1 Tax=Phaeosphaeria nodorum (strain SN15 / ATCC MYA-4574 / FGSC 10173) TaxID=321614 RepID=A0A7U2F748_PHANO|nr:hypothetical protein HBH56_025930 [Parastagonospora nodorum]QRC98913.1 hypothetical protein JI435_412760 [Parastagonospora nodorum SN15]KAH3934311.1 hypothetical protein HBH54_056080 [Parastagonospora nodorum]KAH3949736.1 hypothetical protein HBH53_083770 [Parastagonospora nodorum]KAH3975748.1 hypothetical protein HBH51_081580 [Parastagonospora nodorum]